MSLQQREVVITNEAPVPVGLEAPAVAATGTITLGEVAGASDWFGNAVALSADGNALAVGALLWDGAGGTNQGGVYVYDRSGDGWTQRGSVLTASDAGANDYFGVAVALSADGNALAVGAYTWDGAGGTNQGGVYVYDR